MLFPGQLSGGTNPPFHYLAVIGERILCLYHSYSVSFKVILLTSLVTSLFIYLVIRWRLGLCLLWTLIPFMALQVCLSLHFPSFFYRSVQNQHCEMLSLVIGEKELKIKKEDAVLMRNFRVSILSIPFLPARDIWQMSKLYAKRRKLEPQDTW